MDYAGKVSGVILEKKMSRPCVYFLNLNVFIAQQGRELIFFSLTQNPGQRAPSVLYGSMFLLPHSCRLPLPFPSRGLGFPQLSRLSASVPFPSAPPQLLFTVGPTRARPWLCPGIIGEYSSVRSLCYKVYGTTETH